MYTTRYRLLAMAITMAFCAAFTIAAPVPDDTKEQVLKLNELTSTEAMQDRLTELLKDKEKAKKMVKVAAQMQKEAKAKETPFKFNAALILAKLAHNVKDYETAEQFYEVCGDNATKLQSGSKMLQAYEGLMDLFWEQKKYKSVEEVCQKLMDAKGGREMENAKVFVIEKLVQAKAKQGDTAEALKMADNLVTAFPDEWYILQIKGWVQREAGKFDDAIGTYEDVMKKLAASKEMKPEIKTRMTKNIRYVLSGIHVDNKNVDKAAEQLQILLKEDPDNATFYNDLGFIWADHDLKLEDSEKMIRKALELDEKQRKKLFEEGKIDAETAKKENAAYLDSLGWVLFKAKKYKEAVKYLELAVKDKEDEEGQHIEIWDHLADSYMALGDAKKAVETWQKALKFEDASKRDVERRKKITEKLKKAKAALEEKK